MEAVTKFTEGYITWENEKQRKRLDELLV